MTTTTTRSRPSAAARRGGYGISVLIGAALLYLINIDPGWRALPFLTPDTGQVLTVVNISIAAGLLVNLVYLGHDPRWVTALGALVTTGIGLVPLVRLWEVFPFDFGGSAFPWAQLVRVVLVVAIAGSVIAIVVNVVNVALLARARRAPDRDGRS